MPGFSIPTAYIDPAFHKCLEEAASLKPLVDQFCRLNESNLHAPERTDDDVMKFAEFVHDCIYSRLPEEALESLRGDAELLPALQAIEQRVKECSGDGAANA